MVIGNITLGAIAALLALGSAVSPAHSADPVFPPASRIGLAPLAGLVASKAFMGFEDRQTGAAVIIQELPGVLYSELEKGMTSEVLKTQGVILERREMVALKSGPSFVMIGRRQENGIAFRTWVLVASAPEFTAVVTVQVPEAAKEAYPDDAILAALGTLAIRDAVPPDELLDALPYTLRDLAGLRIVRVLPSNAALLTEGPSDAIELAEQALVLITLAPGALPEPGDRDGFARRVFSTIPGIKDIRLTRSEPLRLGGQPGYETMAEAKDMKTDTEISVVQWLRFGGGGHLRMVGIARKDAWARMFSRFRAVRDGIEPR